MTNDLAIENMVIDNMNLVHFVIHSKFENALNKTAICEYDDLVQTGTIGLLKAAKAYDQSKGCFSTLATTCIKNEILNLLKKNTSCERLSDDIEISSSETGYSEAECNLTIGEMLLALDKVKLAAQKKALLLMMYNGYSKAECAKVLGMKKRYAYYLINEMQKDLRKAAKDGC